MLVGAAAIVCREIENHWHKAEQQDRKVKSLLQCLNISAYQFKREGKGTQMSFTYSISVKRCRLSRSGCSEF